MRCRSREDKILICILVFMAIECVLSYFQLGNDFDPIGFGDADTYAESGIVFAESGVISFHSDYPSALSMPGVSVLIGVTVKLFGTDRFVWQILLRTVWYAMGILTAFFAYIAGTGLHSKKAGLFATAAFLQPNHIWSLNLILTEVPFLFGISAMCAGLFMLKKSSAVRYFVLFTLGFLWALLFRAEAMLYLLFAVFYLVFVCRIPFRSIAGRTVAFVLVLSSFLIPWTVRNYVRFGAFIPVTYGSGNPLMLGTQQGENYPVYEDNQELVDEASRMLVEEYSAYFDEDGNVKDPVTVQFLYQKKDTILAKLFLRKWFKENPFSCLKTYLYLKPRMVMNWSWYWEDLFHIPYAAVHFVANANLIFCVFTCILSLVTKKKRRTVFFLAVSYGINVFSHSFTLVLDRYVLSLILFRYLLAGIGICMLSEAFREYRDRKRTVPNGFIP